MLVPPVIKVMVLSFVIFFCLRQPAVRYATDHSTTTALYATPSYSPMFEACSPSCRNVELNTELEGYIHSLMIRAEALPPFFFNIHQSRAPLTYSVTTTSRRTTYKADSNRSAAFAVQCTEVKV
jgi:hypothetical protein